MKNKLLILAAIFAMALLASCKSSTGTNGGFSPADFLILDKFTNKPISGATVDLTNHFPGWTRTSGADGFVNYDNNAAGNLSFGISAPEYLPVSQDLNLDFRSTFHDTVYLAKAKDFIIASYKFSNNTFDSSGKGHTATLHGCTYVTDRFGKASSALQCNGTTDYLSVPDSPDLNFGSTTDFTIGVWVNNPSSQTSNDTYLINKSSTTPFIGYELAFESKGTYTKTTSGTTYGELYSRQFHIGGDNLWHFYCAVFRRSGTITVYYDGLKVDEVTDTKGYLSGNINTVADLLIGGSGSSNNAYKGLIDDIRIYGVPLDDATVKLVYHESGW